MSQKITIANIEIKEGKSERGDWKNYIITSEDKTKCTTFDNQASNLKTGDIIEAELKKKGEYTNLVSWQVIGHAEPAKPTPIPSVEEMTKQDWAEKDKIARKSVERQKALKRAIEALKMRSMPTTLNEIIATAQIFEHYLETGQNIGNANDLDKLLPEAPEPKSSGIEAQGKPKPQTERITLVDDD